MSSKILTYFALLILTSHVSGQTLLKDIEDFLPGAASSPSNWSAVTDDVFIFQANNTLESQSIFASDGTEAGTIGLGFYSVDSDIIQFGNKAYFGGCNLLLGADSCSVLCVSDGTVAGTRTFFDPDPTGISLKIEEIVAGDSLFYFVGHTISGGYEIWRSNGTIAGTYQVMDIAPGATSGYVGELAVIDDIAYFAGYTDEHGTEPWRSDGTTAGTYMIENLNEGAANSNPAYFTASGGYIYFSGLGTDTGVELRRTNGQQGNVEIIGEDGTTDSSWPRDLVDSDGTLYYAAEGAGAAGYELFVYNHTGNPTHLDFTNADIFPRALMPFGDGKVIFNAEKDFGRELWISDGTLAGTQMIKDLYPGPKDGVFGTGVPGGSFYVWRDSLVYFAGADSVHAEDEFVYELFVTDGTEAGTQLVSDHVPGAEGSNPGNFFEFGGRLYFAMTDAVIGREPYYLDIDNTTAISDPDDELSIAQLPYPNPLPDGAALHVAIHLVNGSNLSARLFDLKGSVVQEISDLGYFPAGENTLEIRLEDRLSGLYYLVLDGGEGSRVNMKILLE
ncbi:MAG: hypothetical protein KDE26_07780 [Bacteroidetes bacterium]|nr:hypothetical protein [Bacteroidota bacterium]